MTSLTDLHELVAATVAELSQKRHSVEEIIVELRHRYGNEISENSEGLENIALRRLIGDASRRRKKSSVATQFGDLFSYYSLPLAVTIKRVVDNKIKKTKVDFGDLTLREVEIWIEDQIKPRPSKSARVLEVEELLIAIRPFMGPSTTIQDAWNAYQEAQNPREQPGEA